MAKQSEIVSYKILKNKNDKTYKYKGTAYKIKKIIYI